MCYVLQSLQPATVMCTCIHQVHLAEVSCGVGKQICSLCRAVHLLLLSVLVTFLLLPVFPTTSPSS